MINGNGLENGRMVRRALNPSQSKDKAKETILQQCLRTRTLQPVQICIWFHCLSYVVTVCSELFVIAIVMVIDIVSLVLCEQPAKL